GAGRRLPPMPGGAFGAPDCVPPQPATAKLRRTSRIRRVMASSLGANAAPRPMERSEARTTASSPNPQRPKCKLRQTTTVGALGVNFAAMTVRFMIALGAILGALIALPVWASVGGPDLAECLGWNPDSATVYFRMIGVNESGNAPTVVRLRLSGSRRFEPVWWSVSTFEDSTYRKSLDRIKRTLAPLREEVFTTVSAYQRVLSADTVTMQDQRWPRYRVRATWFGGICSGSVEATTYRDPSVRMVRAYSIPGRGEMIGVLSF